MTEAGPQNFGGAGLTDGRRIVEGGLPDTPTLRDLSVKGRCGFKAPRMVVPENLPAEGLRAELTVLPEVDEGTLFRHLTGSGAEGKRRSSSASPFALQRECARHPWLTELHPETPTDLCQGALELLFRLEHVVAELTGLDEAWTGAPSREQAIFAGMLAVRAFHQKHGSSRKLVLLGAGTEAVALRACRMAGYLSRVLEPRGEVTPVEEVATAIDAHGRDIAMLFLASPNAAGRFEPDVAGISEALQGIGAQFFFDGARAHTLFGIAKARAMGADLAYLDLGAGFAASAHEGTSAPSALAVRAHLAPYLPGPRVRRAEGKFHWETPAGSVATLTAGHGNLAAVVRTMAYVARHGQPGLLSAARAAILEECFEHREAKAFVGKVDGLDATAQPGLSDLDH